MVRLLFALLILIFHGSNSRANTDFNLQLEATYQAVHAEGLIRAADITLVGITSQFSRQATSAINDLIIHNSLNRHVERVKGINAIFMTDAQGKLRHDSFRYPTRNLDLKDRAYINEALKLGRNDLYIGNPIKNQVVRFDSLPLSRPVFNDDGHITGVGVAIMTPDHLLQRTKICKKCVVSVFKTSGEKVVSFPTALKAQPDIIDFMHKYPANQVVDIPINQLPTQSIWVKFSNYDLVLLYSYFT